MYFFGFEFEKQCCIIVLFSKQLSRSVPLWCSFRTSFFKCSETYVKISFPKTAHNIPLLRGWIFQISHSLVFLKKQRSNLLLPAVKCILFKKKCFIFPLRFFFCAYFFSNLVGIHFFCTTFFPVLPKHPSKLRAVTACDLERQPVNSTISLYFKCYYVKTQILKYNQFLSPHWCFNSVIFLFVCFWDQFVLMLCFAFFLSQSKYSPVQVQADCLTVLLNPRICENLKTV